MLEKLIAKINLLWLSILTTLKILILSRKTKLLYIKSKSTEDSKCVIVGNGPSLKVELSENRQFFKSSNSICVNYFPVSDEFEKIEPNAIVLHAPEFWIENVKDEYKTIRQKIFNAITEKTKWDFIIYAPLKAKKSRNAINFLLSNKYIRVSFYNDTPIEGLASLSSIFFNHGLGLPRPHNVVIPSLMIAIRMNFKEIYLTGVDHSWLKEINVDSHNNVLLGQYHFYDDSNVKPEPMNKVGREKTRNLAEVLEKFLFTFKSYYNIEDYANKKHIKIYNVTKGSYIDAFERIEIKKIKQ